MSKRSTPTQSPSGVQMGWGATTSLLGGIVVWGGAGWLLDYWWGTQFATSIGAIMGMVLGIYAVVARYGRVPEAETPTPVTRPEPEDKTKRLQTKDPQRATHAPSASRFER